MSSAAAQKATQDLVDAIAKRDIRIINEILKHNNKLDINRPSHKEGITPLSMALIKGHYDFIEPFISYGANVNAPNRDGTIPLFIAVGKNFKVTQILVKHGANINVQVGIYKNTPLHEALNKNQIKIAKFLIEYGADLDIENTGLRPQSARDIIEEKRLMSEEELAKSEEIGTVRLGMAKGNIVAAIDAEIKAAAEAVGGAGGGTGAAGGAGAAPEPMTKDKLIHLIQQSIIVGDLDKLKTYLSTPGFEDLDITPALVPAVRKGDPKLLEPLLALKPGINYESTQSLVLQAIELNHFEILMQLLDLESTTGDLIDYIFRYAVRNLQKELIQKVIEKYPKPEYIDTIKTTIIDYLRTNNMDAANILLSLPGIGATNIFETALRGNNIDLIRLLVERNVLIDPIVAGNALVNALNFQQVALSNILLTIPGIDVNQRNAHGSTPLIIAASFGYTDIAAVLLTIPGVLIDAKTAANATALYFAANRNHFEIARMLIEADADVNITDTNNKPPLLFAVHYNNVELVRILLNHDANVNISSKFPDGSRRTIFDYAIEMGNPEIIALIKDKLPKWKGFSRSDIDALNSIFETEGDNPRAINTSCCPVCLKVVRPGEAAQFEITRSEACRYMSHNCQTAGGHYHPQLYTKYKTPEGKIWWCTVCGRICTGHSHHKQVLAKDPKSELLPSVDPFNLVVVRNAEGRPVRNATGQIVKRKDPEAACKLEGGGGLMEKLSRYRRMREFALELQDDIGKLSFDDAANELIEETWNAPLIRKRALPTIAASKTWNIPSEKFIELRRNTTADAPAANVPWPFEGRPGMMPIISNPEGENAIMRVDIEGKAVQLRHRKPNGIIVTHPKIDISTLFSDGIIGQFIVAGTDNFGKCFFYQCGGIIYPDELQYIIDNSRGASAGALNDETYEKYKKTIDIYRRVFNEVYRDNAAFKASVDADIAAAKDMVVGGAGAAAGAGAGPQGGGRRRTRKQKQHRHRTVKRAFRLSKPNRAKY